MLGEQARADWDAPGRAVATDGRYLPEVAPTQKLFCSWVKAHSRKVHQIARRHDLGEELVGSDHRSEIFHASDEQRQIAEDAIAGVPVQARTALASAAQCGSLGAEARRCLGFIRTERLPPRS